MKRVRDRINEEKNPLRKQKLRDAGVVDDPSWADVTDKVTKEGHTLIAKKNGFEFYLESDDPVLDDPIKLNRTKFYITRGMRGFMQFAKGVIPTSRKAKIVIRDINEPDKEEWLGYYLDRIIYIDHAHIGNPNTILHEYAHFLAELVSTQTDAVLRAEYKKLLDNYFRRLKKKKRDNLEDSEDENLAGMRERVASALGLPSPYSATNHDELFASLIEHWKEIPNTKETYRFKQIAKKVISRL